VSLPGASWQIGRNGGYEENADASGYFANTGSGGSAEFLITQPGSYYLTTNIISVSDLHGINISANNVSLDLNGFSLLHVAGTVGNYDGIYIHGGYTNITVCCGTISSWGFDGIDNEANNVVLSHLILSANTTGILWNGNDGAIRDCLVSGSPEDGIELFGGSDCLVVDNQLAGNSVNIYVNASDNQIEGNRATGNGGYGIEILNQSYITNNIVIKNTVIGSGANDYSFNSSQIIGPIITNVISGIITNSNPCANFAF
jgi:parallel beta-helix repeat protein